MLLNKIIHNNFNHASIILDVPPCFAFSKALDHCNYSPAEILASLETSKTNSTCEHEKWSIATYSLQVLSS